MIADIGKKSQITVPAMEYIASVSKLDQGSCFS